MLTPASPLRYCNDPSASSLSFLPGLLSFSGDYQKTEILVLGTRNSRQSHNRSNTENYQRSIQQYDGKEISWYSSNLAQAVRRTERIIYEAAFFIFIRAF